MNGVELSLMPRDRIRSPGDVLRLLTGLVVLLAGAGLAALLSLLVGGAGVAQVIRAWLAQRLDDLATLRCLGLTPDEVVYLATFSRAKGFLCHGDFPEHAEAVRAGAPSVELWHATNPKACSKSTFGAAPRAPCRRGCPC